MNGQLQMTLGWLLLQAVCPVRSPSPQHLPFCGYRCSALRVTTLCRTREAQGAQHDSAFKKLD